MSGDPGVGKSYLALAIAAPLSNGRIPKSGELCTPRDTLYLSIENSAEHVVLPRFDQMNGNLERFHLLRGSITGDGDHATRGSVSLSDVALLGEALRRTQAGLVIVDPVQSYLGAEVDAHRSNETRPILDALVRLAERHRCSFLLLRHLSTAQSGRAIHRGLGSIDLTGAVRTELLAGCAPDDPQRRALAQTKSNIGPIGPTLGFDIDHEGRFSWKDAGDLSPADMLAPETSLEDKSALDEAVEFLCDALANGPRLRNGVISESREIGITDKTLQRAKKTLRVISKKEMANNCV